MNLTSRYIVTKEETFFLTSRVANQLWLAIVSALHLADTPLTFRDLASSVYLSYHHYFLNRDIKEVNDVTISEILHELITSGYVSINIKDDGNHTFSLIVDNSLDTPLSKQDSYTLDFSQHLNNLYA